MSQSRDTGEVKADWRKPEVIINAVLAGLTLAAVFFAGCAAWEASRAADEAKETRFADNRPFLKIESLVPKEGGPPVLGARISNVGKGPATLLFTGISGEEDSRSSEVQHGVHHENRNQETLPATASQNVCGDNFDILARAYAIRRGLTDQKPFEVLSDPKFLGKEHEYWIQYMDIFGNQYRQYFFYNGKTLQVVSYGHLEEGPPFRPHKEFWLPEKSERAQKVLGVKSEPGGWWESAE
jgi:hypothetical protein